MRSTPPPTTIAVLACCLASCAEKPKPATRTVTPSQLTITTTLDGRRDLPLRSRWLACPSAPPAQVAEVEFLIDGTLRAVDHHPPYNYGDDDPNGDLGSLVTSRLKPGPHRFTARARLTDGQTASDTVIARVDRPPAPPPPLAPTRSHPNVSAAAITRGGGDMPAGRWAPMCDHTGGWELDPHGSGIVDHAILHAARLRLDAGVRVQIHTDEAHPGLKRHGHADIGLCSREDGPPATARWSMTRDQLRPTPATSPQTRAA